MRANLLTIPRGHWTVQKFWSFKSFQKSPNLFDLYVGQTLYLRGRGQFFSLVLFVYWWLPRYLRNRPKVCSILGIGDRIFSAYFCTPFLFASLLPSYWLSFCPLLEPLNSPLIFWKKRGRKRSGKDTLRKMHRLIKTIPWEGWWRHCCKKTEYFWDRSLICINHGSLFKTLGTYPSYEVCVKSSPQTNLKSLGKGISKPVFKGNEIHMENQRERDDVNLVQSYFTTYRWLDLKRSETQSNYEFSHKTKLCWNTIKFSLK